MSLYVLQYLCDFNISSWLVMLWGEVAGRLYLVLAGTPGGSWPTESITVSTLDGHIMLTDCPFK